jgi:hypothetical protein
MSLRVTNSRIIIENSSGQEMFDSSDKIIHQRFSQSSTSAQTIGAGYNTTQEHVFNYQMRPKDVAVVYVTLTSASGNVASDVVGSTIQLNFPMLADFKHSTTSAVITRYDMFTASVFGNEFWNQNTRVKFAYFGHYLGPQGSHPYHGRVHRKPAATAISFTWRVAIYTYQ